MPIKNGELPDADEVINAMCSLFNDIAQNLFDADYNGFNAKLDNSGTPKLDNVGYDTFTGDSADTSTNFDHDATNGLYTGTTGETTATLVKDLSTSTSTITNSVSIVNDKNLKSYQDNILEASFETASNWTYSESDTAGKWSGSLTAAPHTGTNSYRITRASGSSNVGDYGQVQQTNVDLTHVDKIGIWRTITGVLGAGVFALQIIIDATSITMTSHGADGSGFTFYSGDIPVGLQTTGKSITIKFAQTAGDSVSDAVNTFDDINIWSSTTEDTKTYTVSADGGANFEAMTLKEIQRFNLTGTNLQIQIVHNQADGTFVGNGVANYVSEVAAKHNLY